jgi:hypothetical protein
MKIKFAFLFLMIAFFGCKKEDFSPPTRAENLPETVDLGKSLMFLNGKEANLRFSFNRWKLTQGDISTELVDVRTTHELSINSFTPGTTGSRLNSCEFAVYDFNDNLIVGFYKIDDSYSNFFEYTEVNEVAGTVAGKFDVTFRRFKKVKNQPDGEDVPAMIVLQGVFNEKYEHY